MRGKASPKRKASRQPSAQHWQSAKRKRCAPLAQTERQVRPIAERLASGWNGMVLATCSTLLVAMLWSFTKPSRDHHMARRIAGAPAKATHQCASNCTPLVGRYSTPGSAFSLLRCIVMLVTVPCLFYREDMRRFSSPIFGRLPWRFLFTGLSPRSI
jgi:hypothetical protein